MKNLTTLLASYVFPYLLQNDIFNPKVTNDFQPSYDYIVVGAGAAGNVIAARLSEDSCVSVLLLEAGGESLVGSEVPLNTINTFTTENDWNYHSVPQSHAGLGLPKKSFSLVTGKGLGGSSIITSPQYARGNQKDYDRWFANGCTGWAWKDVLPYFLKSENNTDPKINNNGYHGKDGPLTVQSLQYKSDLADAFYKAGKEMGYSYHDLNANQNTGFGPYQGTTRFGRRCSTDKAYLVPAQDRPNLDIVVNAFVTKVLINDDKEATGVEFEIDGQKHEVTANKEVIISAGSYNSPQILMLSGIGHKDHLKKLGIPLVKDLPVGDNLQFHIGSYRPLIEASKVPNLHQRYIADVQKESDNFNHNGKGVLTAFDGFEGIAQTNSKGNDPALDWPDLVIIQVGFSPVSFSKLNPNFPATKINLVEEKGWDAKKDKNTFFFLNGLLRPKSRGNIRLASSNPTDKPLVDPNQFSDKSDLDKVVEVAQQNVDLVTKTKAYQNIGAKLFDTKVPGCEQFVANSTYYSPEYLRCQAQQSPFLFYHPVGTCRMGRTTDKTTVVDPQLKVKGIKNLRVADASIMPFIVSAGPNAPVTMIGEKAADLIKDDNPDRESC